MVKVTITVDKSQLPHLSEKMPEIAKRGLHLAGQGLLGELTKNSPVDNGLLRQWFIETMTDSEIHIKTPAGYAKWVNDGTGVYNGGGIIRPKNGKFLVFKPGKKWNGPVTQSGKLKGFVVLRYSRGQRGQKFVEKSIEATRARIGGYFKIAIREVLS